MITAMIEANGDDSFVFASCARIWALSFRPLSSGSGVTINGGVLVVIESPPISSSGGR